MDWMPIEKMPEEWREPDGTREVLFWRDDLGGAVWPSHVAWEGVTHYAIITPPEGE